MTVSTENSILPNKPIWQNNTELFFQCIKQYRILTL